MSSLRKLFWYNKLVHFLLVAWGTIGIFFLALFFVINALIMLIPYLLLIIDKTLFTRNGKRKSNDAKE